MHPELFTLPIVGVSVKAYGFFLMLGFLTGVWLAMRRAQRVGANADTVLDLAFLALLFGVGGARLFYVVHYWKTDFAGTPNPLFSAINITQGGLEFLGGFLGAVAAIVVYGWRKKISLRFYCDVLAPSVMWGLAFGRVGCFLNGCCFGAACTVPSGQQAALPWAVRFPFGSPVHVREWEQRKVTVPAELITTAPSALQPWLLPPSQLSMSVERRELPNRRYQELKEELERARSEPVDSKVIAKLEAEVDAAKKSRDAQERELLSLRLAQRFPSREVPSRPTSVTELEELAQNNRSLPVHPTQLYAAIDALLLYAVLAALFRVRKRDGLVFATLLVLYPIARFIMEIIRVDNPPDVFGLTISQSVSLAMFAVGIIYLVILYEWLPLRSPRLDAPRDRVPAP